MRDTKNYWKDWIQSCKTEFFTSEEMQVMTFFRKKVEKGECPKEITKVVMEKPDWQKAFASCWTKAFVWTNGWTEEKAKFVADIYAKSLEKVKAEMEKKALGNKSVLLKMKNNLINGALVKKTNALNETDGKLLSAKELGAVMRIIKLELGEDTDISRVNGTLADGLLELSRKRQKEEE